MIKILSYISFLSLYISLYTSCEELYKPKIDKSQKEFLVVDGKITNNGESVLIRLTKAIEFTSSENTYDIPENGVNGAIVNISDDIGNTILLEETGSGYYEAYNYHGIIGRTYTLHIRTTDGNEYESKPEMMLSNPNSTSLSAELGKKDVLQTDVYGQTIIDKQSGVNIFVDVKTSEKDPIYYKFSTRKITETRHSEWRYGRCMMCPMTIVYCWKVDELSLKPTISMADIENGTRVIKHFNLGFMQEAFFDPFNTDAVKDPPVPYGWLLSCTISRISEAEYKYNANLIEQLSADSKIFDPLPTQLLSNIRCITDNTKVVLGYFSVSSELTIDYFVLYRRMDTDINQRYINVLPNDIFTNCQDDYAPSFWVQ
jgi:hypothetical protein